MTLKDPVLFDIVYSVIITQHDFIYISMLSTVRAALESSEVICSHSEKTSFPYVACYTERVMGFAKVGDFPKGYRTKLCTLL